MAQAREPLHRRPALVFDADNFADYWAVLISRVRRDDFADRVYSGALAHPLVAFQFRHAAVFAQLHIPTLSREALSFDPLGLYDQFMARAAAANMLEAIPDPMAELAAAFVTYRAAQRYIYSTVIETLRVGTSMHYARAVPFGAGTHLASNIWSENNRRTTMSLMAIFKALLALAIADGESLESLFDRHSLLVSRLSGWEPPITLPAPLHIAFILQSLPSSTYGAVKTIITTTPDVTLARAKQLLRDVA